MFSFSFGARLQINIYTKMSGSKSYLIFNAYITCAFVFIIYIHSKLFRYKNQCLKMSELLKNLYVLF